MVLLFFVYNIFYLGKYLVEVFMEKKSVSATVLVLFLSVFFAVIGICFSMYEYKDKKIVVENVTLAKSEGIELFSDDKLTKPADKLELSELEHGLKPATGELDGETQIPSTIDSTGKSEGYYAPVYLKKGKQCKILVKSVVIESKKDKTLVEEQRKNIFIAIESIKESTKSLEKDGVEIASLDKVDADTKLTFLIWLGQFGTDALEGAKISLTIEFQAV